MTLRVTYDPPPIPIRTCDWSAYDPDTYDGGDERPGPVGYGATREAAIADWILQQEERADG